MIDLILWANTKATFATFARTNGLLIQDAEGNDSLRDGFSYVWWAESGKLVTAQGTYDAEGNELTPPTFLPGFVALCRISGGFFDSDRLDPAEDDPDKEEQYTRSKVARYIKNNGTPGTLAGGSIRYFELSGVRIFRPRDVFDWLASRGLPGHEWLGGNSL